jgi:hypothetical protein
MLPEKKSADHEKRSTITCVCGEQISLVPNVELMGKAIETHVKKHIKKVKDPAEAEALAESLRDDLIVQVFDRASES